MPIASYFDENPILRYCHWKKASPWLAGANPRDLIMPVDGDDGFYPTGNELVDPQTFCYDA